MREQAEKPPSGSVRDGVRVTRDLVYSEAVVHATSTAAMKRRELCLDVYEPAEGAAPGTLRPAVIMAFGGAFHRGSRAEDSFGVPPDCSTSVADYCRMFAQWGCVAFSIDYRLVQEDPDPGTTRAVFDPRSIPRSRVDEVRRVLGLEPATDQQLWAGIEAASDDMASACRFVSAHAARWSIDPGQVTVGGFSAGARTALNATFAEQFPAAAVISISGYIDEKDLKRHLESRQTSMPRVLLIHAEHDLDYIVSHSPAILRCLRSFQVEVDDVMVPCAGHFYPHTASALHDALGRTDVLASIKAFLLADVEVGRTDSD